MKKPVSLARNIKHFRGRLKLSQDALAKRAKINYNTLAKLETGINQNPTLKTLQSLATALNVKLDRLVR